MHELKVFQREDIDFIIKNKLRVLVASSPGTGKTAVAIRSIAETHQSSLPAVVICPASVTRNWAREIHMWAPGIRVAVIDDGMTQIPKTLGKNTIYIISWALIDARWPDLIELGYKTIVGDEAHFSKNADALRSQALRQLAAKAQGLLLLSVKGDTRLAIRVNGSVLVTTIEEAVRLIGVQEEGSIILNDADRRFEAWSFNEKTGRMAWRRIYGAQAHVSHEPLIRIKAQNKVNLQVTAGHSVYVVRNNKIIQPRAADLRTTDMLLMPQTLGVKEEKAIEYIDMAERLTGGNFSIYGDFKDEIKALKHQYSRDKIQRWTSISKFGPYLPLDIWEKHIGVSQSDDWIAARLGQSHLRCKVDLPVMAIAYLVGLTAGDGWMDENHRLGLAIANEDVKTVESRLVGLSEHIKMKWDVRPYDGCVNLRISCLPVVRLFDQWFAGMKAPTKRLPREVFRWTREAREQVLLGIIDSDGHRAPKGEVTVTSTSLMLLEDVKQLLLTLDNESAIYTQKMRPDPRPAFRNAKQSYQLHFWPVRSKCSNGTHRKSHITANAKSMSLDRIGLAKIHSIEQLPTSQELVYDLSVEETENFTAGGVVCHNTGTPIINSKEELENLKDFFGTVSPPMLRRLLEDVAPEVPKKSRSYVYITLKPEDQEEYEQADADFENWLRAEKAKLHGEGMSEYEISRTLAAEALAKIGYLRRLIGVAKADAAVEWIERAVRVGEPVVVFCEHQDVLHKIIRGLKKARILHGVIEGSTPAEERQEIIDGFQSYKFPVFLGTKAAKEGITLTRARHLMFVERFYTSAEEEQAEDRIRRIGQLHATTIWFLHAVGTVDDRVDTIVKSKRQIIRTAIEAKEIAETPIGNVEDLLNRWNIHTEPKDIKIQPLGHGNRLPALPVPKSTHAVLFYGSRWKTESAAIWCRMNGYAPQRKMDLTGRLKLVVEPAEVFKPGEFSIFDVCKDIKIIRGKRVSKANERRIISSLKRSI